MAKTIPFYFNSLTVVEKDGFTYDVSNEHPTENEWAYHPLSESVVKWTSGHPDSMFFFKVVKTNNPSIQL